MKQAIIDTVGFVGIALVSYGAWLTYKPAGFIVGGILLMAVATLISRAPGS
jgi:hypothetical protein